MTDDTFDPAVTDGSLKPLSDPELSIYEAHPELMPPATLRALIAEVRRLRTERNPLFERFEQIDRGED